MNRNLYDSHNIKDSYKAPEPSVDEELREQINKLLPCVQCDGSGAVRTGEDDWEQCQFCYQLRFPAVDSVLQLLTNRIEAARLDENKSLLDVAEHEIKLGTACPYHDTHSRQCDACRKRKMFYTVCLEWKKSIDERIAQLQSTNKQGAS